MKMILEGSNSAETFFTVGWRYWITPSFDLGVVMWLSRSTFFSFLFFFLNLNFRGVGGQGFFLSSFHIFFL